MKNKRGQALVEFILIIPILLMTLIAFFDWIRIIDVKSELENHLDNYIENNETTSDIKITSEVNDNYKKYIASKELEIYSPVLVPILDNKYTVKVDRVLYE